MAHVLIPATGKYVTLYVQINSVGVIKLKILKWGACPAFLDVILQGILIGKNVTTRTVIRERGRLGSQRGKCNKEG